ncbi:MAG: hypothetical protein JSS71_05325 [Armatimonadetes bacterium]|nr:hypothetical protein [Armatimonadota bacterium]MBX3108804.1 hypothetical protein [Fimbriimonadaceae bacterium]
MCKVVADFGECRLPGRAKQPVLTFFGGCVALEAYHRALIEQALPENERELTDPDHYSLWDW